MSEHGSDDCLHCVLLRLILDRAKTRRAAGIKHNTADDIARVTEVLGQLLGTISNDTHRAEMIDASLELLAEVVSTSELNTKVIMEARAAMPKGATRH